MAQQIEDQFYSVDSYFELLNKSLDKYEFFRGRVYLMSGGTPEHAIIIGNTVTALNNALDEKDCQVYSSEVLIQVQTKSHYTFSDATVVCGQPSYEKYKNNLLLTNPELIVEVLSPSTHNYDRGTKFQLYKAIKSFQDYLLIDSRQVYIQHFRKIDDNTWQEKTYKNLNDTIFLENFGIDLEVGRIYRRIKFEQEPEII
ncbi:MAG: Uma2 family endonuclease [Chloroflexi bacterium]|nr:Uma2 family endonuclease [Chloroflexota bacterium]OJV89434.1 MAG: hypothetical protein BGO39_36270 [Chloroflexi bacterium 54-19]